MNEPIVTSDVGEAIKAFFAGANVIYHEYLEGHVKCYTMESNDKLSLYNSPGVRIFYIYEVKK